jgi:hypothetical protein
MRVFTYNLARGDTWNGPTVRFVCSGVDLSAATVRAKLKTEVDGRLIHDWTLTPELIDEASTVVFTLADTDTKDFPVGTLSADVEFYLAGFGRYTPIGFKFHVEGDITV